jgi:formylglycine-generating enzyme required for sulfatase activity
MTDSGFQMVKTPDTYCDWQERAVSERHPVRCVNAYDAATYASWFQNKYGDKFGISRLTVVVPTAGEWELAARAGRWTQERQWDRGFAHGAENCDFARSRNCGGNTTPDPVAKLGRKPNSWGLYDTMGNVWEWTGSVGSVADSRRILGGSYYFEDGDMRFDTVASRRAEFRGGVVGIRVLARLSAIVPSSTSPTR